VCVNLNGKVHREHGMVFCGMNYVRDYPFGYKHWCAPDGDFIACPVQFCGEGLTLDAKGRWIELPDLREYLLAKPSLHDRLESIRSQLTPDEIPRSIWLVHCPPAELSMDICSDGRHRQPGVPAGAFHRCPGRRTSAGSPGVGGLLRPGHRGDDLDRGGVGATACLLDEWFPARVPSGNPSYEKLLHQRRLEPLRRRELALRGSSRIISLADEINNSLLFLWPFWEPDGQLLNVFDRGLALGLDLPHQRGIMLRDELAAFLQVAKCPPGHESPHQVGCAEKVLGISRLEAARRAQHVRATTFQAARRRDPGLRQTRRSGTPKCAKGPGFPDQRLGPTATGIEAERATAQGHGNFQQNPVNLFPRLYLS